MPFKSEKQRRFLWAEHPEIAKRWADKYPESNKNLPLYADKDNNKTDKDSNTHKDTNKQAAAPMPKNANDFNVSAFLSEIAGRSYVPNRSILDPGPNENCKKADSKQERVDIPRSEKPTYAGEEREKGMISSSIDTGKNINESCGKNAINELLQKLSVVLAPAIEQTMENMNAENEGRVPVRVGKNRGLKQYPQASPHIPLPMGMQQAQPQQTQQPQQANTQKPANPTPVGAGQSSATTDPIKFHSGLSASGIINGNASLSAPNTVNTKISSAENVETPSWLRSLMGAGVFGGMGLRSGALLGGLAGTAHGAFAQPGEYTDAQGKKQKQTRLQKVLHDALSGVGIGGLTGGIAGGVGGAALPFLPEKKSRDELQAVLTSIDQPDPEYLLELLAERVKSAVDKWAAIEYGGNDAQVIQEHAAREKAIADWEKKWNMKWEEYVPSWERNKKPKTKKQAAETPAWQRAAGKNDEGGLNAKGRASYNRETGGNLKAPVTEKNPKGERDKRQNSFCSRMCGMKKHETGSKTKKDPDSRINKALRKWNCKCGSDKNAFVTGFVDDAINNATPLIGGMAGGAAGALGGGALGGLHGAISPGEYTDETGKKKQRNRLMAALRGALAGAGVGGVGGAVGGAVGLPMLTKKSSPAETFGKAAFGFHEGPYRLGQFLFKHEPWTETIGNITGNRIYNPGLGYTGAGAIGAGLGSLIGAYNAEKGKKLRGALRGGLIGAGTGLGARAAGGLTMSALDDSVLNSQYPALAAALGGGFIGSAAGAGIADGVEDDLDEHKKTAGAGGGRAIGHALEEEGVDPAVAALAGLAAMGGLYGVYHGGKKLLAPVAKRLSVSTLPDDQIGAVALPTNPTRPADRYTFAERYRQPSLLGSLFIDSDEDAISRAITQVTKRNPAMLRRLEGQSGSTADLDSIGKTLVKTYPHRFRLPVE